MKSGPRAFRASVAALSCVSIALVVRNGELARVADVVYLSGEFPSPRSAEKFYELFCPEPLVIMLLYGLGKLLLLAARVRSGNVSLNVMPLSRFRRLTLILRRDMISDTVSSVDMRQRLCSMFRGAFLR